MSIKIGIVGGSGFIGTRLCDRLVSNNDVEFIILDKEESIKYPNNYSYCDITNYESVVKGLSGVDLVVNLAAEHKDNVLPKSKYFDVNVDGQRNICDAMSKLNIEKHIFTSSVAVYGFVQTETDETGSYNPFSEYGESKLKAERVLDSWFEVCGGQHSVVRPTVVFGEGNRGNVYNLLRQIASGRFVMVGSGENKKSMAYVENVAAFIEYLIFNGVGYQVFNYVDKPDLTMNELCTTVCRALSKRRSTLRLPYIFGLMIGYTFDLVSKVSKREFSVSSIRIKKFCAATQFGSKTIEKTGFKEPVLLSEGISRTVRSEFLS